MQMRTSASGLATRWQLRMRERHASETPEILASSRLLMARPLSTCARRVPTVSRIQGVRSISASGVPSYPSRPTSMAYPLPPRLRLTPPLDGPRLPPSWTNVTKPE